MMKISALAVCLMTGCARPQPVEPRAGGGMTLADAQAIVAAFETKEAERAADEPLRNPASLEEALDILKRDQIDLFGAGVAFAAQQEGLDAEALHAQLELAWGGGQSLLVYILRNLDRVAANALGTVRANRKADGNGEGIPESFAPLAQRVAHLGNTIDALDLVSQTHNERGAELAKKLIEKYPDNYEGYRVAADYYRMAGDWDNFTKMVTKIEETNPASNGLVFVRGVAAAERDGDPVQAAELFRRALAKDPQFVRARAHLLLVQTSIEGTFEQLQALEALNPHHQIVTWAGPIIRALYATRSLTGQTAAASEPAPTGGTGETAEATAPTAEESTAP